MTEMTAEAATLRVPLCLGVLAGAAAMTRPEAVLYATAFPLLLLDFRRRSRLGLRQLLSQATVYGAGFAGFYGAFLAFRFAYFGRLVPNTYYVKGGLNLGDMLGKTTDLMSSVMSDQTLFLLPLLALLLYGLRTLRQLNAVPFLFMVIAATSVMLMPQDWMTENRFCTPFIIFFYLFATLAAGSARRAMASWQPGLLRPVAAAGLVALSLLAVNFGHRSLAFRDDPVISMVYVRDNIATPFDTYAAHLGIKDGTLLAPDIGGALYWSGLRVYDLAGLTDATIARTVLRDKPAFYDYVFETAKPTFIRMHTVWSLRAELDDDGRFRRDYLTLCESRSPVPDAPDQSYVSGGSYVRKDAVNDPAAVERVRAECVPDAK